MRDLKRLPNDLLNMRDDIDRMIEHFFSFPRSRRNNPEEYEEIWVPSVNTVETENELKVYMLLPFARKEDINVSMKENILKIEGETKFNLGEKEELLRSEIPVGKFERTFKISYPVDVQNIKANYRDGVLEIILPKKEEAKVNKINVE